MKIINLIKDLPFDALTKCKECVKLVHVFKSRCLVDFAISLEICLIGFYELDVLMLLRNSVQLSIVHFPFADWLTIEIRCSCALCAIAHVDGESAKTIDWHIV